MEIETGHEASSMMHVYQVAAPVTCHFINDVFRYRVSQYCQSGYYARRFRLLCISVLTFRVYLARMSGTLRIRRYAGNNYDCSVLSNAYFNSSADLARSTDRRCLASNVICLVDANVIRIFPFRMRLASMFL